jgi:hypothetical protein
VRTKPLFQREYGIRAYITHWIEYVCHGIIWRDFLCLWDHIIPDQWDDPSSRGNRQNFKLLRFRIGEVGMTLPKICVFDRISWQFRLRVIPSVKSEEQSLGSITEGNYGIFVPCGFTRDRIYSFRKLQRNKFFWSIFRWIRRPFSAWYLMESLTGAVGWNSSENCIVRTVSINLSESSPQQLSCWFFEYYCWHVPRRINFFLSDEVWWREELILLIILGKQGENNNPCLTVCSLECFHFDSANSRNE